MPEIESEVWQDITEEILNIPKNLKFLQVVSHEGITLEETMHAHEINDWKIDPKFDISPENSIGYMLEHGIVTLPEQLTLKDCSSIYASILKAEAQVLRGYPLAQTIYTFIYLYDSRITVGHPLMETLLASINCIGKYIYDMHKESCSIKEDDLGLSSFSFSRNTKPNEEIIERFIVLEKKLEVEMKQEKSQENKEILKGLIALLKLRRAIHTLNKSLGEFYDSKNENRIVSQNQTVLKRCNQLMDLLPKNPHFQETVKGVFSDTIYKTLRSHFGPREIPSITVRQAIEQIKNGLIQFELFVPLPRRLWEYRNRLQILSSFPLNLWSKSYIKNNIFNRQNYLFNTLKTEQLLMADINDWCPIRQVTKNDEKFINLIRPAAPVISQTLFRLLGRPSRWFWECSKAYEDFNVLIHMANELDSKPQTGRKDSYICSWFYNYIITLMIKQLQWGIEEDLYQMLEYPYVICELNQLLSGFDQNSQIFLMRLEKGISESFYEQSLNSKKKKKIPEQSRKIFADILFKKGLHYYFRAFYRTMLILIQRGYIKDPFANQLATRVKNRFRIFKNVLFAKQFNLQMYTQLVQQIHKDQKKYLQQAMDLLRQGRKIFTLFSQFDQTQTFFGQRGQCDQLSKICVKCSLVVMSLKMEQAGKEYQVIKSCKKYPELAIK